jgi:hypothetical protein
MSISISDFVSFSVAQPSLALPAYNVNSLALLTADAPLSNAKYGTGATGSCAVATFPGPITGVTLSTGGTLYTTPPQVFLIGGGGTGAVVTATLTNGVVTALNLVNGGTGYTSVPTLIISNTFGIYTDPISVGNDFGTSTETYALAQIIFSQNPNILSAGGQLVIYPMASGMTLTQAIAVLQPQIYTGGYIYADANVTTVPSSGAFSVSDIESASTLVNSFVTKALFFAPTASINDLYGSGMCATISSASQQQTRLLIHTAGVTTARKFAAGYAARLFGTNFNGANTTMTMNLKQIVGIGADTGINETIAAQCQIVGVDFYALVQGLPEVVSTGGNGYSDNVYNLTWLLNSLQVSTFNTLATTSTKIPQTEAGMNTIKSSISQVLNQAVANGFLAPGTWTGALFGNPASLATNIKQYGYYVYSQPVSQQLQSQRAQRIAPLVQIAVKYAGAIQSVNGIIYINY